VKARCPTSSTLGSELLGRRSIDLNISLPPQLKWFVEKKVKEGVYLSEGDVVCDALRGLRKRDHLLRPNATGLFSSSSSPYDFAISNIGVDGSDIEAVAFIVLTQVTNDMDKDLNMIMAEMTAMIAAKQKLRSLINTVNKDVAFHVGQTDRRPPLNFQAGMGSQKAYHHAQMPFADPESEGGVKFVLTDLIREKIVDVSQLVAVHEALKGKLKGMNEMLDITSLRLQMMMDRRSKFLSMLSNIMMNGSLKHSPVIAPSEYASRAPNYLEGRQAGRAGLHDAPPLPREWFFSDAKFEAYVVGWKKGNEERLLSES
jgi:hypothetical protein